MQIFPGGVLPSVTALTNAISKGSKNTLILEALDNIGPRTSRFASARAVFDVRLSDYAPTLREWKKRFMQSYDSRIVPALKAAYPELKTKQDAEVFRRKWICESPSLPFWTKLIRAIDYFDYCAAGFAMRVINDHIFTVSREGNLSLETV